VATNKQKRAVDIMVENGGNASKAMREAGYSPQTAKTPKKLTGTKGYQEILEEYGLTEALIVTSLVKDINTKEGNRVTELTLGAKIRGMLTDRTDITTGGAPIAPILVKFVGEDNKQNS